MSNKKVISMLESIPQYKSMSETNKIYSKTFKKNFINRKLIFQKIIYIL